MFYTQEDIDRIREEISCLDVLDMFGIDTTKNRIHCINTGHIDNTPSMRYENNTKIQNCLHCWACGERYDVIETYSILSGKGFYESVADLYKILQGEEVEVEEVKKIKPKKIIKETKVKSFEALKYYKDIHTEHLERKFYIDYYLKSRGINYKDVKELLTNNHIDLLHNYYNGVNKILIAYRDYDYYIERLLDKKEYYNHGKCKPIVINNGGDLYIFEGFFDCLAFVSRLEKKDKEENSFIILNSVENIDKLDFSFLNDFNNVVDVLDKDAAGREGAAKINNHLKNKMIELEFDTKDYNEYILKGGNK